MLVRFVEAHRRGLKEFAPGDVLELPAAEALILLQDCLAVPVTDAPFARSVLATENAQRIRDLADIISGQIAESGLLDSI